jgi:selenocysteine-specific elongation factor
MATEKHIIVGTAGHIDHGKSSLVEALTGTNPDRLEEEKRRGITIDLGFAFLDLDGVKVGFVDVPGHERFVRNMLAGAGGIDLVLLVVAADESIKPQTREHFEICRLLGISRGLVAITKSDLVDKDVAGLVRLEIEDFVRGSFLEGARIVLVSVRTGAGMSELRDALRDAALGIPDKDTTRHFRLPIDRSFAMRGFGAVVTGTLVSGAVKLDDEADLYPQRTRVRIRGLQSGGMSMQRAIAGQRTAVNLAGVEHTDVQRGMVLAARGVFEPTRRLDARIDLLRSAYQPLKNRARVHFHQGTAETIAEIQLLESSELEPGGSAFVQLRLEDEVLLLPGDRFILRQFSPVVTIGGGHVLDIRPPRHRLGDPQTLPLLRTLEGGDRDAILQSLVSSSLRGLTMHEIIARTGWVEAEVGESVAKLQRSQKIRVLGQNPLILISQVAVEKCTAAIRRYVESFHRENPLLPGVPKQDVRGRSGNPSAELYQAALDDLVKSGAVTVSGDLVHRAGREIALTPEEARAKEMIETEFARAGLAVPSFEAVLEKLPVESKRAAKILQILLREKVLLKLADDLVFHRDALASVKQLVARYKAQKGVRLPVPVFKELAGVTRKYAIPLLEYLDREQVTRRAGDERVIL